MGDFLEQFDKVPASQKMLLLILVCAGIFVAFYLVLYTPLDEEIASAQSRASTLQTQRAELMAGSDSVERIQEDIRELCARQESFMEKLPPRAEVPSLLQSIHQQARLVGLEIERFTRAEDVVGANYTRIPVQMEVSGTYDQVVDFFYFIGRQQRIVNVSNIAFAMTNRRHEQLRDGRVDQTGRRDGRAPTTIGPPILRVNYEVSTYYADAGALAGGDLCAE